MRFALFSDLHLETQRGAPWKPPMPLDVDAVLLAGDIHQHARALRWASETFSTWPGSPPVVYVAGNHEYYGAHLGLTQQLRFPEHPAPGVHFLENAVFTLPGARILGCTLWSSFSLLEPKISAVAAMREAARCINDYADIQTDGGARLSPGDTLRLHQQSVIWLDKRLAQPFDGKTIVLTHFAPHHGCVAPKYADNALTPYFVADLANLMKRRHIDAWCHGHTHTNVDFIAENGCRVVSNQRGYPRENPAGFNAELVLEV